MPRRPFPPLPDWLISPLMGHMLPKPIWGSDADEPCGKTKHSHSFKNEIAEAQRPHCLVLAFFFSSYGAKIFLSISIGLFPYIFTPISPLWYYIWLNGHCRTAGCIWRMVKQTSSVWWICEQYTLLKWDCMCVRATMVLRRAIGCKLAACVCLCDIAEGIWSQCWNTNTFFLSLFSCFYNRTWYLCFIDVFFFSVSLLLTTWDSTIKPACIIQK